MRRLPVPGSLRIPELSLPLHCIGVWRSWLAHLLWEQGVPRSSRGTPTEIGTAFAVPISVGITSVSLAGGLIPQTPCVASLRKHRALVPRTRPPPGRLMTALVPSHQCFPGIGCDSWRRRRWLLAQVSRISGAGVILEWGPAPQNRHSRFPMAQVSPLFPHLRHHMATPAPADGHTCAKGRVWRTGNWRCAVNASWRKSCRGASICVSLREPLSNSVL